MKTIRILLILLTFLIATTTLVASGMIGIYGIVEKVVFEPNDKAPERVKVWGAFRFADPIAQKPPAMPETHDTVRGYVYFKLPSGNPRSAVVLKEWMDLKSLAGTGQAIAFGHWDIGYYGLISGLPPANMYVLRSAGQNKPEGLRVWEDSNKNAEPVTYTTNTGIVKLAGANYARVIAELKDALRR